MNGDQIELLLLLLRLHGCVAAKRGRPGDAIARMDLALRDFDTDPGDVLLHLARDLHTEVAAL